MDNVITLCGDCHRREPGAEAFLEYQKKGGSKAWLFRMMSLGRRLEFMLFWPCVIPSAQEKPGIQQWWEKRNRAMKKAGYDSDEMSDWLVDFNNWEGS